MTTVVPGEADMFCAVYLKRYGGIVFTGDSDLLVHDLGSEGAVVFFDDIGINTRSAPIFKASAIAVRLALPKPEGLQALAFEMIMTPYGTFKKLLSQAILKSAINLFEKEYNDFSKEYALPEDLEFYEKMGDLAKVKLQKSLQNLDPRISEYVMHFPSLSKAAGHQLSCPGTPRIFLPFLLGCPVRTHAWEMSTSVRQLAYGLINLIVSDDEHCLSIYEHRRQLDNSAGREWQLPGLSQLTGACVSISNIFSKLQEKFPRKVTSQELFLAFAIYQEVEFSSSVMQPSLAKLALRQNFRHQSWDTLQLLAQLQGSFYSFRIMKQITSVLFSDSNSLPEEVVLLHRHLEALPSLIEYPALSNISFVAQKVKTLNMIEVSMEILGLEETESRTAAVPNRGPKKKGKAKKLGQPPSKQPPSNNPFNVLGLGSGG
jgi:hypothetical protein